MMFKIQLNMRLTSEKIKYIINNLAFSLIELSLVLIIIALLTSSIIGGATLIQNTKVLSAANEVRGYKQAISIFQVAKDRLPGDMNGSGKIGYASGQVYDSNSFAAPYNGTDANYGIPCVTIAPWVDLYLGGVIDFKPRKTSYEPGDRGASCPSQAEGCLGVSIPNFKSFRDTGLNFEYFGTSHYYYFGVSVPGYYTYGMPIGNYFVSYSRTDVVKATIQDSKTIKSLDSKVDDGLFDSGKMRAHCSKGPGNTEWGYTNYNVSIETKGTCGHFYISIN